MKEIKEVFKRISKYLWLMLLAVVLVVLQCILELALPMIMSNMINNGIINCEMDIILSDGRKILIIGFIMCFCGYLVGIICAYVSQKFSMNLRQELYSHSFRLSQYQLDKYQEGTFITLLLSDIEKGAQIINFGVILFVEPIVLALGGIYMMWNIAKSLGIVFALFVCVQLLIMVFFIFITKSRFLKIQDASDGLNTRLQSVFSNIRFIKSFLMEESEKEQFSKINMGFAGKIFNAQKLLAIFNPLVLLVMNSSIVYIIYYASNKVNTGLMSVGNMVAAITYSEQILLAIMVGGQFFKLVAETTASWKRIFTMLDVEPEMKNEGCEIDRPVELIEFREVAFAYNKGNSLLSGCDFKINSGEFVCLMGSVGSGKSTIAALMGRIYDVLSGDIFINGKSIKDYDIHSLRRHIAIVQKSADLFSDSIEANISLNRASVSHDDVLKAINIAQCEDFIMNLPDKLDTPLSMSAKTISGGEKQRIMIARALALKPDVLVLDDSTSALDYETENKLIQAIRENYTNMAIVMITNREKSTASADRILRIDNQSIVEGRRA